MLLNKFLSYIVVNKGINLVSVKKFALQTVRDAFKLKIGKITKSDIMELCPSLSRSSVEKALRELIALGYITKHGNGTETFYIYNK